MPIDWMSCTADPLRWIAFREILLTIFLTPWLFSFFVALIVVCALFFLPLSLRPWSRFVVLLAALLLTNGLFSSFSTQFFTAWLSSQLPVSTASVDDAPLPIAVLLGRGPQIAKSTTLKAASLLKSQKVEAVYVSGDDISSGQMVVDAGVSPIRVSGDSCARTTWENALLTNAWLQVHHPGAPVLLITDRWHLPRATYSFAHQGLTVLPLAVSVDLSSHDRNRFALRETVATFLYRLLGRM